MRSQLLRRGASMLAVSALSVTVLGVTSTPANAHPAGDRAVDASANWLKGQLQGGVLLGSFGPEIGPSIDAGLAFDSLGRAADAATVADGIAPHLVTTANFEYGYARATEYDFDTGDEIQVGRYANATAKAAAFTARLGLDPSTEYADIDLVAQLEDLTNDTTGRISDDSSYETDYANAIGQAYAAEALTAVGSSEAAAATTHLLEQQCAAGYFRFDLGAAACSAGDAPDLDVTALAVLSLVNSGLTTQAATDSIGEAAAWLRTQQSADGSFANSDQGTNANSTGLAAWALAEAGDADSAAKAAGWLRGVQIADIAPCTTTLAADNGAVAPQPQALATARTAGAIPAGQRLTYAFATAQALPALAHVPAGTGPLTVSAPTTAVEKSTVTVTVAGLGAGEAGCVSFGSVAKPVTGTGSDVTVQFDLPAGAAANTFTLTTLAGSQTAVTTSTLAPVVTPPMPTPTPAPVPTPAPALEVGALKASKVEVAKKNKFKLAVTCEAAVACDGRIVVRTTRKVKVGDAKRASKVLIAKKAYSVEPGETEKVVLKVRKRARAALADGRIKVKAVQTAKAADTSVTKFWLRSK